MTGWRAPQLRMVDQAPVAALIGALIAVAAVVVILVVVV